MDPIIWHFMTLGDQKKELANKDENATEERKVIKMEVKSELNLFAGQEETHKCREQMAMKGGMNRETGIDTRALPGS